MAGVHHQPVGDGDASGPHLAGELVEGAGARRRQRRIPTRDQDQVSTRVAHLGHESMIAIEEQVRADRGVQLLRGGGQQLQVRERVATSP